MDCCCNITSCAADIFVCHIFQDGISADVLSELCSGLWMNQLYLYSVIEYAGPVGLMYHIFTMTHCIAFTSTDLLHVLLRLHISTHSG